MPNTGVSILLTGMPEAQRALNQLPAVIIAQALPRSLQAGAAVIRDELERNTPYNILGTSISGRTARTGSGNALHAGRGALRTNIKTNIVIDSRLQGGYAEVGFLPPLATIARLVEYGHRIVGHRPGLKDTGKQVPPHPFIRPSFEASMDRAIEAFANTWNTSLERGITGFAKNPKKASAW